MEEEDRFVILEEKNFEWFMEDKAKFKKISKSLSDLMRFISKEVKSFRLE